MKGSDKMENSNYDKKYLQKVSELTPKSPLIKDCLLAFLGGGTVCVLGEVLYNLFYYIGITEKNARTGVSITLIVITAILTGVGVYDRIAKHFGAGVAVPISGFANSVCAPAIEYTVEGHVLGTSEKMFSLAGAVIVYGCSLASFYGMVYYFFLK